MSMPKQKPMKPQPRLPRRPQVLEQEKPELLAPSGALSPHQSLFFFGLGLEAVSVFHVWRLRSTLSPRISLSLAYGLLFSEVASTTSRRSTALSRVAESATRHNLLFDVFQLDPSPEMTFQCLLHCLWRHGSLAWPDDTSRHSEGKGGEVV